MKLENLLVEELTLGGGTLKLDVSTIPCNYLITGSGTLLADWAVGAKLKADGGIWPIDGDCRGVSFRFLYIADLILDGSTINFFSALSLTDAQAASNCIIDVTCTSEDGGTWTAIVTPDYANILGLVTTQMIAAKAVTNAKIGDKAVDTGQIADAAIEALQIATDAISTIKILNDAITSAKILAKAVTTAKIDDGAVGTTQLTDLGVSTTKIADLAVTDVKIAALAVITAKINDLAVTTAKIADGAITAIKLGAGSVTASKLETSVGKELFNIQLSFEAGEVGTYQVPFPYACTILFAEARATKAIAGTDDATIQLQNNATTDMTDGLITLTASTAFGVAVNCTPSANNIFAAGEHLKMVSAKTTAGGKANVTVYLQRIS